jgi:hypothetical protein
MLILPTTTTIADRAAELIATATRHGDTAARSILHNPPLTLDAAQQLAADLARNMHLPAHVVNDGGRLIICDDEDVRVWQLTQVVWSVEPESVYE